MKRIVCFIIAVILCVIPIGNAIAADIKTFSDIQNHWAKSEIQSLVDSGVISGYKDGTFKPDQNVTRAEFIKMLVTSLKAELTNWNAFDDTKSHWSNRYVYTALTNGLIKRPEYGNNFMPDKNITRLEMVRTVIRAMLTRYNHFKQSYERLDLPDLSFSDLRNINSEDLKYIQLAIQRGLVCGFPNGTFQAEKAVTRAQSAKVLTNMLTLLDTQNEKFIEPKIVVKKDSGSNNFSICIENYAQYSDDYEYMIECVKVPEDLDTVGLVRKESGCLGTAFTQTWGYGYDYDNNLYEYIPVEWKNFDTLLRAEPFDGTIYKALIFNSKIPENTEMQFKITVWKGRLQKEYDKNVVIGYTEN